MKNTDNRCSIKILRKEIEENPGDYKLIICYADALLKCGKLKESEKLYKLALMHIDELKQDFLKICVLSRNMEFIIFRNVPKEHERLCLIYEIGAELYPNYADFDYMMGCWLFARGLLPEAAFYLEMSIKKLNSRMSDADTLLMEGLNKAYQALITVSEAMGDKAGIVKYSVLSLALDGKQNELLKMLLDLLKTEENEWKDASGTYRIINSIYNMDDLGEKLYVLKCAKLSGFPALENKILQSFTESEKEWFESGKQGTGYKNAVDAAFYTLMDYSDSSKKSELVKHMEENYFKRNSCFGRFNPDINVYEAFYSRAVVLKRNCRELIHMYEQLADYRSKKTLLAILRNWAFLDTEMLGEVKETGAKYFDIDIFECDENEVLLDLGANTGDTVKNYIKTYGTRYKRIYCYEFNQDILPELERNTQVFQDIIIKTEPVYDIPEPVTFIKIDVMGDESSILKACSELIREYHPKLAVSICYSCGDIWRIADMISEIDSSYRFYFKYYGGTLTADEYVLLAV